MRKGTLILVAWFLVTCANAAPRAAASAYWDLSSLATTIQSSVVGVVVHHPAAFGHDTEWLTSGTGIIYRQGHVITTAALVEGADRVSLLLPNRRVLAISGDRVRTDDVSGLAVIDAGTGLGLPATFGDSAAVTVGEPVIALGNPLGFRLHNSITAGIISAVDTPAMLPGVPRHSWLNEPTFLQTDAPTVVSASGGPLVNGLGQVVGVSVSKAVGLGTEGVSYALPGSAVLTVADALIASGRVARPWLGLQVAESEPAALGLAEPEGLRVAAVHQAGPAWGRILPGDRITAANDRPVSRIEDLETVLRNLSPGDPVGLDVLRSGQPLALAVALQERPPLSSPPLDSSLWRYLNTDQLLEAAIFAYRHRGHSLRETTLAWRAQAPRGEALLVSEFLSVAIPLQRTYADGGRPVPNAVFVAALQSRGTLTIWVTLSGSDEPGHIRASLRQGEKVVPGTPVTAEGHPEAATVGEYLETAAIRLGFQFPSDSLDTAKATELTVADAAGNPLASFRWDLGQLR